jgi:hypothetical protein
MKTKVEVLGYEIEIEEVDGVVTVKAELDGETVEEFTLETPEEGEGQEDDDVQSFDDFDSQEDEAEDFEDSEDFESEEGEDTEEGEEENDEDKALESFQSFFEKKRN